MIVAAPPPASLLSTFPRRNSSLATGPSVPSSERPPPACAEPALVLRPPLLVEAGRALAVLESVLPGGADQRALTLWDPLLPSLQRGLVVIAAGNACASLAGAAWARARGMRLRAVLFGAVTHEQRETLALWGATCTQADDRDAAQERARELASLGVGFLLPPLDGAGGVVEVERSLGLALARALEERKQMCGLLVGPAGARAVLLGAFAALRGRAGTLRCVALVAASPEDVLPELPLPLLWPKHPSQAWTSGAIELFPVTLQAARSARDSLGKRGFSLSHAAAATLACTEALASSLEPGAAALALCTQSAEHEFSLDARGEPG
jgi:hypothetical protein